MTRENKINWWLRLAAAGSLFRVASSLTELLFVLIGYVIPLGLFRIICSYKPIIIPLLCTSVVVVYIVVKCEGLLARSIKTKVRLALILSAVALCPVYLKQNLTSVMVSPLEMAIQDGCSDEVIQTIIDNEQAGNIDKSSFGTGPGHPTPLSSALYADRTNVVRMLLRKGASPDKALASLDVLDEPKYGALIKMVQEEISAPTNSTFSPEGQPSKTEFTE